MPLAFDPRFASPLLKEAGSKSPESERVQEVVNLRRILPLRGVEGPGEGEPPPLPNGNEYRLQANQFQSSPPRQILGALGLPRRARACRKALTSVY